jgi:hypothetical protein
VLSPYETYEVKVGITATNPLGYCLHVDVNPVVIYFTLVYLGVKVGLLLYVHTID